MKLMKLYRPLEKKRQHPGANCHVCARRFNVLPIALILSLVLSFQSCKPTRLSDSHQDLLQTKATEKVDSMKLATKVILKESIPASKAVIAVSLDSLIKLPLGAKYSVRNDRSTAEVSITGDTVYITAMCDSLERWVEYYESMYSSTLEMYEESQHQFQQEYKKITGGCAVAVIILTLLYLTIVIITINLKSKK